MSLKEVMEARRVPKNVVKARVGLRLGREAFAYHHMIIASTPTRRARPRVRRARGNGAGGSGRASAPFLQAEAGVELCAPGVLHAVIGDHQLSPLGHLRAGVVAEVRSKDMCE